MWSVHGTCCDWAASCRWYDRIFTFYTHSIHIRSLRMDWSIMNKFLYLIFFPKIPTYFGITANQTSFLVRSVWIFVYIGRRAGIPSSIMFKHLSMLLRQKGGDLTKSYDKSPYTNRNFKRAKWKHKQRHKKGRLNSIADRLRTGSWSNYSHPTGVVNLVYGPTFPLPTTAV